jgi:hypothetical protein
MQVQPVPFQSVAGPQGWSLDLVPHPFVGMAAESIEGYLRHSGNKPTMRLAGKPTAWSKRVGPFTVWAWADGSIAVKPLSGAPIPFPMWLHKHPTYPTHMPDQVPADLDLGWLCSALVLNALLLHKRRFAEVESGNPFTEAYPLWWLPGRHPQAGARGWDPILDGMASVASAWYKATGTPAPHAICFSVMGGVVLANGTILPARLGPEHLNDPAITYLHAHFGPILSSLAAVAMAWSAEHLLVDGHPDPNHRIHVPVLTPGPITLVTKTLQPASAHLALDVSKRLALCTV